MMDIEADELLAEFGDDFTVTRRAAASYGTTGIATAGATTTLTIRAAIWPASGKELQRLPEGRRAQETRAGVTTTQLLTGGQGAAHEADLVTIDGVAYEVQLCNAWPNVPGFYEITLQRPNVA